MKSSTILLLTAFFSIPTHAQQDGYWDKERTTNKQIIVPAREKIIIKSEDFPVGTTEIVYRITLLDDNQEIASSLVSLLKAVPDPTGISKGSAGAIFLMSKISGDDKCTYSIFSLEKYANEYQKSGKNDKACFFQNQPVNKEVKLLSVNKSACLTLNSENIYFGIESKNWIMNQKMVLEIVPWVDKKLSRGWNSINKQMILNQCKLSETTAKLPNSDNFCICQLQKIQEKFRFFEYDDLLEAEKTTFLSALETECLKKTGANDYLNDKIRTEIDSLILNFKYELATTKLQNLIKKNNARAIDFNNLGFCYLMTKQYQKASIFIKKAIEADNSELLFQLNLAHVFMLLNDTKSSKKIHEKYNIQNINSNQSWVEKTKSDFDLFQKSGLPINNFNKILRVFE